MEKSHRTETKAVARRDFLKTGARGWQQGCPRRRRTPPTIAAEGAKGANSRLGVGFHRHRRPRRGPYRYLHGPEEAGPRRAGRRLRRVPPAGRGGRQGAPAGKIYRNHEDLLADPRVDVVCIATPDRLHAPQAIDAVRAGKDVYVREAADALDPIRPGQAARRRGREAQADRPGGHAVHGRRRLRAGPRS